MSNTIHKSFTQLKKEANVTTEPNQFSIKQWLASTNKLLDKAKLAKDNNDYETVYINNLKASSILLEIIPRHKDYNNEISRSPEFYSLKNNLPHFMENAEEAAKALESFNKNIDVGQDQKNLNSIRMPEPPGSSHSNINSPAFSDPSLQSGNTKFLTESGLHRSPVYIVSDNMIGSVSSDNSSNSMVPMTATLAERLMSLRNNGLNVDNKSLAKDTLFSSNDNNPSPNLSMPIPIPTPPLLVSNNSSPLTTSSSSTESNVQQSDPLANFKTSNLISAGELLNLFKKTNAPKILILDVRNRSEFDAGHIKTDNIVCLEPLILSEGISTIDLESHRLILSPVHEQELFKNRDKFDLVVYHDKDSVYSALSGKFTSPSSAPGDNVLSRLKTAIYESEYKKILRRFPVLLSGGFEAWKRLAGEKWIEKTNNNNENAIPRDRISFNNDRSKRNGLVIPNDDNSAWVENMNNERPVRSPSKINDIISKIQNNEPISSGRAPYVTTVFELFQKPSPIQSMTNANYVDNSHSQNNYYDQPIPKISSRLSSSPPSILSQPNLNESKVNPSSSTTSNAPQSGAKLQRRKTRFDNPYYSFSEVGNPDYAPPKPPKPNRQPPPVPPPKRPLPQAPESTSNGQNTTIPSLNNNDHTPSLSVQAAMQQRPSSSAGQAHQRFPTSDSSFSQLGSGIGSTGLKNLGNTCFMNSIIQCLSGTVPFARYFLDGSYKRHINTTNLLGTKGVLADAFSKLIRVLWSDQYTFVSPVTFKEAIGRFAPQFSGTEQQDSQEFLSFLLDGLHEDLNIIKDKQNIPDLTPQQEEEMEDLPPQMASEIEWEKYLRRNSSVVVSLFQGQFRNTLRCLTCNKTSTTHNAFMCLSLPIPHNYYNVDLHQCLNAFVKEEILDGDNAWNCPRCQCRRRASKQLTISRLPDVLLIHLKRFSFNGPFRDKLETTINFPIRNLDLTPYIPPPIEQPSTIGYKAQHELPGTGAGSRLQQSGPFIYDLFAVSNHYGGLNGGHYTACVRNGYRHEWHNFDDSRVSTCDERQVMTRAAYNLFYVRTRI